MRRLAVAALALLGLAACGPEPDAQPCVIDAGVDAAAASIVSDSLVGVHVGTLTWLETKKQTQLTYVVSLSGSVDMGSPGCPGQYVTIQQSARSSDGVIQAPPVASTSPTLVDNGHLRVDGLDLALDAAALIDGGTAPEQPSLSAHGPQAGLHIAHTAGSPIASGTVTVGDTQGGWTLGTISF